MNGVIARSPVIFVRSGNTVADATMLYVGNGAHYWFDTAYSNNYPNRATVFDFYNLNVFLTDWGTRAHGKSLRCLYAS